MSDPGIAYDNFLTDPSIVTGWTAQQPFPHPERGSLDNQVIRFHQCATCQMQVSSVKGHLCPALIEARRMAEHIPPKAFTAESEGEEGWKAYG